jgi:serine/threonine protein kinase
VHFISSHLISSHLISSQQDLRERYPGTDDAGLDLLKAMLKFDPAQRITVDAALAHPYLASVRNLAKEQAAARPMSAEIETIGEDPEHIHANVSAHRTAPLSF